MLAQSGRGGLATDLLIGLPADWRFDVRMLAENLPDWPAADAVRARIDSKDALALPLADPGFDHTVMSEFRRWLVEGGAADG